MDPCPCPFDPCPIPGPDGAAHRVFWAAWARTGDCPSCGAAMTPAQAREHACPNRVVIA
jgi:hypothetical protein